MWGRSIVTLVRCRAGIGRPPGSRQRSSSNAGCRRRSRRRGDRRPRTRVVRASISGADGGAWDLVAEGGTLDVRRPGARRPTSGSASRWPICGLPWAGPIPISPRCCRPAGRRRICCSSIRATWICCVRSRGACCSSSRGRRRRRWALDVGFGKAGVSAGRPRSTLRLDAATFEGLRSGAVPPMQPLLDGRLKIEGDRALAMQLLLLLGSRLGRR